MDPSFQPAPEDESFQIAWPTPRHDLFSHPQSYFAATPANPDYGRPGWTRDGGKRFHGGVDIAPLRRRSGGRTVTLLFTDLATGREYPAEAPTWIPEDEIYCVADGVVAEAVLREEDSDFGLHVVVRHAWPRAGTSFFTLYGHLAEVGVSAGQPVGAGTCLGRMGGTSRIADARLWLAAFPHLHFEVRDAQQRRHDPLEFLGRFIAPQRR